MENNIPQDALTVALVAFYNVKALGIRYLETALRRAGFRVVAVYLKTFNSRRPEPVTHRELELLREKLRSLSPVLVGLSVMSSMYLETVDAAVDALRGMGFPIVCGGAFATMYPEYFLDRGVDFVVRGDGEKPVTELARVLAEGGELSGVPSLCRREGDKNLISAVEQTEKSIDLYGLPTVCSPEACLISGDRLLPGDPQRNTLSYEVVASRGCPFRCSYCCCTNLSRLLPPEQRVRTRSVESVIGELRQAKEHCQRMVFVHFYDEIFPNSPSWVDDFVRAYRREIGLPFTIWSHPRMLDAELLKKLVGAGLTEVIVGIQSGSQRVRREVFHREESNEQILRANELIQASGVFWVSYDLMLRHPFETLEDLKESYRLVKDMSGRYELQLHGLNFLPGTDIVDMAVGEGLYTREEMDSILFGPMSAQFRSYWDRDGGGEAALWYDLIYIWQFKSLRPLCLRWESDVTGHAADIARLRRRAERLAKLRYVYKKATVTAKSRIK